MSQMLQRDQIDWLYLHFIKTSVILTTVLNLFMKGHRIEHSKGLSVLREGLIKTIFKLYANNSFQLKSLIH